MWIFSLRRTGQAGPFDAVLTITQTCIRSDVGGVSKASDKAEGSGQMVKSTAVADGRENAEGEGKDGRLSAGDDG